jgi:hypothetical protein
MPQAESAGGKNLTRQLSTSGDPTEAGWNHNAALRLRMIKQAKAQTKSKGVQQVATVQT